MTAQTSRSDRTRLSAPPRPVAAHAHADFDPAESTESLLARAQRGEGANQHETREALFTEVVTRHLGLADGLSARFAGTGEERDDLTQVARLGLVLAVHRYDAASSVPFTAFATPTIVGELKRHVRDHAWAIRPPRRLQELRPQVLRAQDELTAQLCRTPTVHEVADRVGQPIGDVIEALTLGSAYSPDSLDAPATTGGPTAAETLTQPGSRMDEITDRMALGTELARLPARSREVIRLRFVADHPQRAVAREIGVSQMQVSRILTRAVGRLRSHLLP